MRGFEASEQLPRGVPEMGFERRAVELADGLVDPEGDWLGGKGEEEGRAVQEEKFEGQGILLLVAAEVESMEVREEEEGGGVREERPACACPSPVDSVGRGEGGRGSGVEEEAKAAGGDLKDTRRSSTGTDDFAGLRLLDRSKHSLVYLAFR